MKNKNAKLGTVYLEVEGLDKERFKEVTKMVDVHPTYSNDLLNTSYIFLENWYSHHLGYTWFPTDEPEPEAKLITLDELERLLNPEKEQQPTHFAISPEDYSEYQELKKLKETLKKLIS